MYTLNSQGAIPSGWNVSTPKAASCLIPELPETGSAMIFFLSPDRKSGAFRLEAGEELRTN